MPYYMASWLESSFIDALSKSVGLMMKSPLQYIIGYVEHYSFVCVFRVLVVNWVTLVYGWTTSTVVDRVVLSPNVLRTAALNSLSRQTSKWCWSRHGVLARTLLPSRHTMKRYCKCRDFCLRQKFSNSRRFSTSQKQNGTNLYLHTQEI